MVALSEEVRPSASWKHSPEGARLEARLAACRAYAIKFPILGYLAVNDD